MFENKTFENILANMLSSVQSSDPEIDINVGSVIYTALAPIAMELETAYRDMNATLEETLIMTASKDYLIQHGNQIGVPINGASHAYFNCETNVKLEIGTRFNNDMFNYTVIQYLSTNYKTNEDGSYKTDENGENIPISYVYAVICETAGSEPNAYLGDLTQITYVPNLTYAKLTSILTYGEDEEDTEAYRYRLQVHCNNAPIGGNVAQYNEWLDEYPGIGHYKVTPLWNGANTVKLTILSPENTSASEELIKQVQNDFDPITSPGMGDGLAPIGAVVTVDTCTEVNIVLDCQVRMKEGYTTADTVKKAVDEYIKSLVLTTDKIAYLPISAAIYNAEGVSEVVSLTVYVGSYGELTIDSLATNPHITLAENEIPMYDIDDTGIQVVS